MCIFILAEAIVGKTAVHFAAWCAAGFVVAAGCGHGGTERQGAIIALVAASTTDAMRETAALFQKESGVEVTLQTDDSSRLATQILEGAPADLFLSASERWADVVKEKGLVREATLLLGNRLVAIVPRGNPAHLAQAKDLTLPAVKHIALAGPTVPAGQYGREALKALKLWDVLEPRVVSGQNVRATLAYVERGEAEAGIVYATDARVTGRVEVVYEFAADTHAPIRYPLVLLKAPQEHPAARQFYRFLQSPRTAEVFRKFGFTWIHSG
jgi:molybdate transport system substrate-binding protein